MTIGVEPNTSIQTIEQINYKLNVKDLSALELLGSGNIDASNIGTDRLRVAISGSGDVKTAGEVDKQDVVISGSGNYKAENLESKEAKIDVRGAGLP